MQKLTRCVQSQKRPPQPSVRGYSGSTRRLGAATPGAGPRYRAAGFTDLKQRNRDLPKAFL